MCCKTTKETRIINTKCGRVVILGGIAAEERYPQKFGVQSWGGGRFVTVLLLWKRYIMEKIYIYRYRYIDIVGDVVTAANGY